ncbi:MAG: class I adenylate-forming enzyme family protein [Sphingobium sp.]
MSKDVADQPRSSGLQHAIAAGDIEPGETLRRLTLGDLLREAATEAGDRIAMVDGVADPALRQRWTYAELLDQAEQAARALLGRFRPGDRIAVCSPNCPEWVILEFGTALAGMVLVPVNPAYRQSELAGILQDCEASAVFHADEWRTNDIGAMVAGVRDTVLRDLALISFSDWDAFLASGANSTPLPPVSPRDPVLIQFTSGTTGRPKGAVLHHGLIDPPRNVANCCGFPLHGVWLNAMPMYHIGGAAVSLLATFSKQGTFVQMREWDPALALTLIEAERCNGMLLVPTMVVSMLDQPDFSDHDLSSIDFIVAGAAPVPPALLERVTERIGCRMLICFGQTEAGGPVTNTAVGDGAHELANTLGRALPGMQIEIRDPQTGATLPTGGMGELCFKSSQLMLGYYGREAETRAAFTSDGWLRSGDLGMLDERGYISITGRLKEMIIRGGINIYPREVEDTLFEHPSVAQAAVIGIPDDKWGEILVAVVQAAEGRELRFEELYQHCRERLASFKVPALWCQADSFPLNPTGKIQKFVLGDWVRDGKLPTVSVR